MKRFLTAVSALAISVAALAQGDLTFNPALNWGKGTGSGTVVFQNSPTLVTPVLGVASGTSLSLNGNATALPAGPTGTLLQIGNADGTANALTMNAFGSANSLFSYRANTSNANPSAVASTNTLWQVAARGYGATGYSSANRASIALVANENWSDSAQGTQINFNATTATTTTTSLAAYIDSTGVYSQGKLQGTVLVATTSSSPASNAACTAGTIYWDANYIYICTATGVVKRAALTGGY